MAEPHPVVPPDSLVPGKEPEQMTGVVVLDPAGSRSAPQSPAKGPAPAPGRIRRLARRLARFAYDLLTEIP